MEDREPGVSVSVGALVLAAGAGRRMGRGPKALLLDDGVTFLERCVGLLRGAGCDPIWVVVRPDAPELLRLATSLPVRVVMNEDPERGMFSSVQAVLKEALGSQPEGFVVQPVDHPHVRVDTVRLVARVIDRQGWIVPRYMGRSGHPVGIGREVAMGLLDMPENCTLREALERVQARRVNIDVGDSGILENVNT